MYIQLLYSMFSKCKYIYILSKFELVNDHTNIQQFRDLMCQSSSGFILIYLRGS